MLNSLHIENIAVVKSVDIDFSCGFTVFTGETGAGKSVIVESIKLLLGGKFERDLIRHGEERAAVSGFFSELSDVVLGELENNGLSADEEGCITVQRTMTCEGKSQIKINGRTVGIGALKSVMPLLLSIHGQTDTNALTASSKHIEILDVYADNEQLMKDYAKVYSEYEDVRARLNEHLSKKMESERLREILSYQIKDIDSAGLNIGEEEELIDRKVKIRNSEKLHKHADFVYKALRGSEKGSVAHLLDRSITALSQISDVVPVCSEYAEQMRDMLYRIEEIAEDAYAITDDIGGDTTEALNSIESRLDKISKLKRKYGLTISSILEFRDKCVEELDGIDNFEQTEKKLRDELSLLYQNALKIAEELHNRRKNAAEKLEKSVKATLDFLDMPKVNFYTHFKEDIEAGERKLTRRGYDSAEFYICTNKGAESMPMSKIASGGELARIMLALKSALADKDGISTVIYDEIDTGVSGKTARKIGIKLLSLSKDAQILCVTHSAQIASLADTHMLIKKGEQEGKTETTVAELDYGGRVAEVSRILGGIDVTNSQKEAAVDMIREKSSFLV